MVKRKIIAHIHNKIQMETTLDWPSELPLPIIGDYVELTWEHSGTSHAATLVVTNRVFKLKLNALIINLRYGY